MANRIDVTTLLAGPRHSIVHAYIQSDGASGDLDSYELMVPGDFQSQSGRFTIDNITWSFTGFSAKIHFEILVEDTLIWVLPESTGNFVSFEKYGGLKDRSNPADATGKILLTTTGLETTGDEGSLVIQVRND